MVLKAILLIVMFLGIFFTLIFTKSISKFFSSYIKTISVAIPILIYAIIMMWLPAFGDYISFQSGNSANLDSWNINNIYSSVFLLQLPSLMVIVYPLMMIVDKSKTIAKTISPFLMVYCFMGILIRFIGFETITVNNMAWYEYIFLGERSERIFFLANIFCLFLSLFCYLSSKTYTKWSFLGGIVIIMIVISYYLVVISVHNIQNSASGLVYGDWQAIGNHTAIFLPLYHIFNIDLYVWQFNLWFFIYLIMSFILVCLKNYLTLNPIKVSVISKPWFDKSTFLKGFLTPLDAAINNLLNSLLPYGYFFPKQLTKMKLKNFKLYYNGFIAMGDIEKYGQYVESLEHSLSNEINYNQEQSFALVSKRKKNKLSVKELKRLEKEKIEELEREIENQYKMIDYDKTIKQNQKMQKEINKEIAEVEELNQHDKIKEIYDKYDENLDANKEGSNV